MKLSPIIYLDASFVIEAYEYKTKRPTPIKTSKTESLAGGISAGLFSTTATTVQTKEFPINIPAMYEEIESELKCFVDVDLDIFDGALPDIFWASGFLGSCESVRNSPREPPTRSHFLKIYTENHDPHKSLSLLVNDVYFSFGYDQLRSNLSTACHGFNIPIKGLFRYLTMDTIMQIPVCSPLVLIK